jgi:hypothetical protein
MVRFVAGGGLDEGRDLGSASPRNRLAFLEIA